MKYIVDLAVSGKIREYGMVVALLLICGIFSITSPVFLTQPNIANILNQVAINAVLAVGATFVILSGGIDLGLGSYVAITGVLTAMSVQNEALTKSSGETINAVLERFGGVLRGVSDSSQQMAEGSQNVRERVEAVLVHLQFQDRTSQILNAVCHDIDRLLEQLREQEQRIASGESPQPFDVQQWIAELEQTYTTLEQFGTHPADTKAPVSASEITFF